MNFGLRKTGSIGIGYESGIDWDKNLRFRGFEKFYLFADVSYRQDYHEKA